MKGLMIESVVIVAIVIISSVIVINILNPTFDRGKARTEIDRAEQTMNLIDTVIRELVFESAGASREIRISSDFGIFDIRGSEDKIKFSFDTGIEVMEPGTSIQSGNLLITAGPVIRAYEKDIDSDGNMDLVLENDAVLFAVNKTGSSSSWQVINTTSIITRIGNKRAGVNITPVSGIYINDETGSS
jgi:hypothetical protein